MGCGFISCRSWSARGACSALPLLAAALLFGCSDEAPIRAEIEIVIDTDVPLLSQVDDPDAALTTVRVDRLRIDVFDATGTRWIESRDFAAGDPSNWPVTFGVRSAPDDEGRTFRLRVRAYPSGRVEALFVRDELGDIVFDETGTPIPVLDLNGDPEQAPRRVFTVDRLVHAKLEQGARQRLSVFLAGDCMGVEADVVTGLSCVQGGDQPAAVAISTAALEDVGELPASKVGSWARAKGEPCLGEPRPPTPGLFDEDVCVQGGVFHLGDDRVAHLPCDTGDPGLCDAVPERVVAVSSFFMDRFHVTVGRMRAAMLQAEAPFAPQVAQIATRTMNPTCVWTGPDGHLEPDYDPAEDGWPINCISTVTAREFCQWAGGDLPTEAQWEYAATAAGRSFKTVNPWGDTTANCDGVIFERGQPGAPYTKCTDAGHPPGIAPVDSILTAPVRDETPPPSIGATVGIVGMAGLMKQIQRDGWQLYSEPCWQTAPFIDPICSPEEAFFVASRGSMFNQNGVFLRSAYRSNFETSQPGNEFAASDTVGFRCVRLGAQP